MTLTSALRQALANPPNLEPLRAFESRPNTNPAEAQQATAGQVIRVAIRDADHLVEHIPIMLDVLKIAGASLSDLARILSEARPTTPRSAEWVDAALRLAAWADSRATADLWAKVEIAGQTYAAGVTLPERPPTTKITITLVALDGSGVHGIGADLAAARAHAMTTRDDGDPAWLDTLRAVTLSGEPAAVQALVEALSSVPAGGNVWEGT